MLLMVTSLRKVAFQQCLQQVVAVDLADLRASSLIRCDVGGVFREAVSYTHLSPEARDFYDLEHLWADGEDVTPAFEEE